MANEKNLKPFDSNQCREKAKINGRKGGIASGVKKRERKAMKEQAELLLSLAITDEDTKAALKELGIEDNELNNQMALIAAMYKKALAGDTSAMNVIRELVDEKVTKVSVNTNIDEKVKELNSLLDVIDE